jgi:hypothetical protein
LKRKRNQNKKNTFNERKNTLTPSRSLDIPHSRAVLRALVSSYSEAGLNNRDCLRVGVRVMVVIDMEFDAQ